MAKRSTDDENRIRRNQLQQKIRGLENEKMQVEIALSGYPAMPHDGVTDEEMRLSNRHSAIIREPALHTEAYENSILDSLDIYLSQLSADSRWIKWFTIVLVAMTAILAIATLFDFLVRLGFLK